jgi:hypothetical protein
MVELLLEEDEDAPVDEGATHLPFSAVPKPQ